MAEIIKKYDLPDGNRLEVYDDGKTIVRSAKTGRVVESTTPPDTARLYSELGNAALDQMTEEERAAEEKQAELDMATLLDQLGLAGDQAAMLYGRLAFRGGVAAVRAIKELVDLSEARQEKAKGGPKIQKFEPKARVIIDGEQYWHFALYPLAAKLALERIQELKEETGFSTKNEKLLAAWIANGTLKRTIDTLPDREPDDGKTDFTSFIVQ
jgi:hypothetical protein